MVEHLQNVILLEEWTTLMYACMYVYMHININNMYAFIYKVYMDVCMHVNETLLCM